MDVVVLVAAEVAVDVVVDVADVVEIDYMFTNYPHRITFQWHITDQCNFRCMHCYQSEFVSKGLPFQDLESILDKLKEFVDLLNVKSELKSHINFTGGEPYLREDFIDLLTKVKETNRFTFGILSNGYIPNTKTIEKIKTFHPKYVQISLEGRRKTNDKIRGKGSYDKIIKSLKAYKKQGIPTMLSFTANSENYFDYPHVVKIARKYKVKKIWTDRYLPSTKDDKLLLKTDQFKTLGQLIKQEKNRSKYYFYSKTEIAANRALQFLFTGDKPYKCSAGNSLLAILSNGDLVPCRRLPLKIGNVLADELIDLYQNSEVLNTLRDASNLDKSCSGCYYKKSCNGGLKCLSYALTNDYNRKDINCFL